MEEKYRRKNHRSESDQNIRHHAAGRHTFVENVGRRSHVNRRAPADIVVYILQSGYFLYPIVMML